MSGSDAAEQVGLGDHCVGRLLPILRYLVASLLQELEHCFFTRQPLLLLMLELLLYPVFAVDHIFQMVEDT